jgi:hypothetical protein
MAVRCVFWNRLRGGFPLSSQIGVAPKLTAALLLAIGLIALPLLPVSGQTSDIADVRITSGQDLRGRLGELMKNPDIRAALQYFENQKLQPYADGLAEVKARRVSTNEALTITFIPLTESTPSPGLEHVIVSAEDSKGSKVLLGTISSEPQGAQVQDDKIVVAARYSQEAVLRLGPSA